MTKWRPWIIGIAFLASGTLLFFAGFFSRQFSGPPIPELASRGLLLVGLALVALHSTFGINMLVWSIRADFDDASASYLPAPFGAGMVGGAINVAFALFYGVSLALSPRRQAS